MLLYEKTKAYLATRRFYLARALTLLYKSKLSLLVYLSFLSLITAHLYK